MRLNLTENEKVKALLKKGLRYFLRAVAKFSQTLDFFLHSDTLFLPQKLGKCEKTPKKSQIMRNLTKQLSILTTSYCDICKR